MPLQEDMTRQVVSSCRSVFLAVVVVEGIYGEQCVGVDFVANRYVALFAVGIALCRVVGCVFGAVDGPGEFEEAASAAEDLVGGGDVEQFYSFFRYYAVRPDNINMFRDSATVYVREPEHGGKCRAVRAVRLRIPATDLPKHGYRVGCRSLPAISRLPVSIAAAGGQDKQRYYAENRAHSICYGFNEIIMSFISSLPLFRKSL